MRNGIQIDQDVSLYCSSSVEERTATFVFNHTSKNEIMGPNVSRSHPNGDGTGPASASDLLMLPMPHMMHPGVVSAENLAPHKSQTSCPMVERRLRVAAQKCEGSSNGSIDLFVNPL